MKSFLKEGDFMDAIASNISTLVSNTVLDKISFFLDFFMNNFNFSDLILYFLGSIINILPGSPVSLMMKLINTEDITALDHTLNYINWIIPFDIFVNILEIWIPFVFSAYIFRFSWSKVMNFLEGLFIK